MGGRGGEGELVRAGESWEDGASRWVPWTELHQKIVGLG